MPLQRIKVTADTVKPIKNGHPWVYHNGMNEHFPAGTPLLLLEPNGKTLAFGLADEGAIAARVLGKNPDRIADLLRRRITLARDLRRRLINQDTNTYRLINGAGDGLPGLVVDRYADLLIVRIYGKCWERHLDAILDGLDVIEGITNVYRRFGVRNVDGRKGGTVLQGKEPPETLIVQEHGLRFLVRPKHGQKTGLFLDQREHRKHIGSIAKNLRLVNLFAYTGGFSLFAAAGGATSVHTVDISPQAIADAKENFKLNDIDTAQHIFEVADVFKWQNKTKLDLVICDPPALSHRKKSDHAAIQAYQDLARQCGSYLPKGGILASASCTSRLSQSQWEKAVTVGLRKTGTWSWLWRANEPPDHPVSTEHLEGRYLKFSLLARIR